MPETIRPAQRTNQLPKIIKTLLRRWNFSTERGSTATLDDLARFSIARQRQSDGGVVVAAEDSPVDIIDIMHQRKGYGINSLANWIASLRKKTDAIQLPG